MINYSVYMMGNPIKPAEPEKAYAKNQINEVLTFDRFVRHIAHHNGVFSRGTVKGVISDMCSCLEEQLLNGNKVQLGELGTFSLSMKCNGATDIASFTSNNIEELVILFNPGPDFEGLRKRAVFNNVPSRIAQEATLKAEKAGQTNVDLEAAKKKNNTKDETNITA